MRIGGFHPASFNNYPGRVAALVFTQGCNFRCPYCHNAGLIDTEHPPRYQIGQVLEKLTARKGKVSGVVISGGEPTLQEALGPFCRQLQALGLKVKLDTNGSRPAVLAQLLAEGLLDYIAMDLKAPMPHYQRLAGVAVDPAIILRSAHLIAQSGIPHHFRTTVVPSLLIDEDLATLRELVPAGSAYRLQPFREPPQRA